jgi:2-keto-3-deoxy-L-rhamnonate aldolase RhmA/quercetin dioxygenase-like cupin family protein
MKTAALRAFRKKLAANLPVYGLWVTLEAPSVTEIAVAMGLDWIVIDAEHGHLDWKEIVEHLRATVRSDTVALVRVASLDSALIKRALDIGADGIVVPWVESADQFRQAVAFAHYPTEGTRGIGAERATCWGQCFAEHTDEANENVLVIPIIETVKTMRQVPLMTQVEGAEMFFFGPADYSATAGYRGQWEGPGVAEQILSMKDVIRRAGKHCGLIASSEADITARTDQGFRMIGLGMDAGLMIRSLRSALQQVKRSPTLRASLESQSTPTTPLERPPESMRPDRKEVMCPIGSGNRIELNPGVMFECLVGGHNKARNLTTGWVTFAPSAALPCHTHTFTESITLLSGSASVEVEGRIYHLKRMDNLVIPAGLAHTARNVSNKEPLVLQVAMGTDTPSRTLVNQFFSRKTMPDDSTGVPGAERVNRFATAHRFAAGPNTEFIDFFNETLVPGIEMSGGYGLFKPGGRLPAHVHDFDESICIISGSATCIVEGRRYRMSDGATALQPRGRVHYFINETQDTMEMLWVYAGPMPERIIVQEQCATEAGDPWRP